MAGSIRTVRVTLTSLVLAAGFGVACPLLATGDDKPAQQTRAAERSGGADQGKTGPSAPGGARPSEWRSKLSAFFSQPGDDPPRPFVPLRPATVDDRRRTEAVRLYSAARALEDQHKWPDAVALLQEASKLDPDSVAIARRLNKIYIGAMGRPELAEVYGRKVLTIEPGDTETLGRMVDFYMRPDKSDSAAAERLLKEVLANPKLNAHAPGRLLAEFELGQLYANRLKQPQKAADAYAKVIDALDDKSTNRFSPADLVRVLGNDPSRAYLNFALSFITAGRDELAVRALERALVYDEDNPQIAMFLAETLLRLHKADQAVGFVERIIRRQPQGVEVYELLAKVLTALGREKEITPRLEEAALQDSKNVPLQYVLADRYRETGQIDKADALYKTLLTTQPTPQTYRALAASLLKRKKAGDLLKVICEAYPRPITKAAIEPQLQAAAADDAMAEAMLDAGFEQLSARPPTLPESAFHVLTLIANTNRATAGRARRLEKLLKLHRLHLEQEPSALVYSEIADTQIGMGHYAEAAATVEQLLAKYPAEKSMRTLAILAGYQRRAGRVEAAKAAAAQALKLDSNDAEAQYRLASVLADLSQADDAIRILRDLARKDPNNAFYELGLGQMLSRFSRNDEAIKVFEGMVKRYVDNDDVLRYIRSSLSVTYVNMGNYAKGESELELLLENNPDEPGTNNDLGYLYADQGKNLEKAESMIRKALQDKPDEYAYLDSLGWVLFKQGKVKEALQSLIKAAELMKPERDQLGLGDDPTIFEHLGDVYFQLHEIDNAEDSWRKALKASEATVPPDKRVAEIKKKLDSLRKLGPSPKPSSSHSP
jgi:tetratricopeptide (TPR) repeat protein